ncbi:MAG TPA: hypothetical protein VHE59_14980 [Mucilaginibacter sp.]|nr:hypothetical protein [Mucilaginibacter sp.]
MGYETNVQAYNLLIQIEVGIREFFIFLIKEKGIEDWFTSFFGNNQRQTISEFIKSINERIKQDQQIAPEESYLLKINKITSSSEYNGNALEFFHPFYYLNWPDLEMLLRMKLNSNLIDSEIGGKKKESLCAALNNLNDLRNDIAHSRFITDDNLEYITVIYNQVKSIIPNFLSFVNSQTKERNIKNVLTEINSSISTINSSQMISYEELKQLGANVSDSINSFWLNSLEPRLIVLLKELDHQLKQYEHLRNSPGGLLGILRWKKLNEGLITNISNLTLNGKI